MSVFTLPSRFVCFLTSIALALSKSRLCLRRAVLHRAGGRSFVFLEALGRSVPLRPGNAGAKWAPH